MSLHRGTTVEQLIFGTTDAVAIDAAVAGWCEARLGSAVEQVLLRTTSVGMVRGVRLADGRRVVVKVHQPRERRDTLADIARVQAHLHGHGFPCPALVHGPEPLGGGLAVAEEYVDVGEPRDTHQPRERRLMAESLAWHLELARACGAPGGLAHGWSLFASDRLWPAQPHSPIFDFEATAVGAEWIDALAARAKPLASESGDLIAGHHDWSGEHFRFAGDRVAVVYDWDSLRLGREAAIVGVAAATFTHNPPLGAPRAPAPDEMRAFVDEYSAARAAPLTHAEREQVAACGMFVIAYIARCEHCRAAGEDLGDARLFIGALREHGAAYMRV